MACERAAAGTEGAAGPSPASVDAVEEVLTRPISACADAEEAASWTGT